MILPKWVAFMAIYIAGIIVILIIMIMIQNKTEMKYVRKFSRKGTKSFTINPEGKREENIPMKKETGKIQEKEEKGDSPEEILTSYLVFEEFKK